MPLLFNVPHGRLQERAEWAVAALGARESLALTVRNMGFARDSRMHGARGERPQSVVDGAPTLDEIERRVMLDWHADWPRVAPSFYPSHWPELSRHIRF